MSSKKGYVNVKWLIITLVLIVIVFFVFHGSPIISDTYNIKDYEFAEVSYEVLHGDADAFTCELKDSQKLVITYDSEEEFEAILTLTELLGKEHEYRLTIGEMWDDVDDKYRIMSDLEELK